MKSRGRGSKTGTGRRSASRLGVAPQAHQVEGELVAARRRRFPWAKLPGVVLLAVSLLAVLTFLAGTRFRVREVTVEGTQLIPEYQVHALLDVADESIFTVQPRRLEQVLLSNYRLLASVQVRCVLPNRVVVTLTERRAVLVWESGGRMWWVDSEGGILGETDDSRGLAVIHDVNRFAPEPTDYLVGVPWQLAQEMLVALPGLVAYDFTPEDGLIVYVTSREWPVYLGFEGNAAEKASVLRALVDTLVSQGTNVQFIDLRNERRAAYKQG